MANIIDTLQQDHKNICRLLGLLEKQVDNIAAGEFTDYQVIADIMHYFVNYPDVYHHPHEDILFNAIKMKDIKAANLIDEIVTEHQSMAEESATIYDDMQHIQGNAIFSREEIVQRLRDYIASYHAHIEKEETGLFALAKTTLDEDDWREIDNEIGNTDDPLFGKIRDQEYQELYKLILSENVADVRSEE